MRNAIGAMRSAGHIVARNRQRTAVLLTVLLFAGIPGFAGTVTGTLQAPNGLPVSDGVLSFRLRQAGLEIGTGAVVPVTTSCFTSTDGSVVGLPNPQAAVVASVGYGPGMLPAGEYYVKTTFYSGAQETLPSPEARIQLTGAGSLIISPPVSWPSGASGMRVYIGTSPGGEELQGQTASSSAQFNQSTPLVSGANPPSTNDTPCTIAFNDTIIPYTGYDVSLLSSTGAAYPGWPQGWQLNGGSNGVVNVSQGAPLWNGVVVYPQPILAQPLNHGPQSVSGPLDLSGYGLVNAGRVGVGTRTPSWPIDVENGEINSSGGYLVNGGAGTAGDCLVSNGAAFLPGTCFTPESTFYQSLESDGAAEPQEPAVNFSSSFALQDSSGSATSIDLASSGVAAGSYSNATITVNSKGQVTSAVDGVSLPHIQAARLTTGICTTGSNSYDDCQATVTWPVAFPDANYIVSCWGIGPSDPRAAITGGASGRSASAVVVTIVTEGSVAVTYNEIDCIGVHP